MGGKGQGIISPSSSALTSETEGLGNITYDLRSEFFFYLVRDGILGCIQSPSFPFYDLEQKIIGARDISRHGMGEGVFRPKFQVDKIITRFIPPNPFKSIVNAGLTSQVPNGALYGRRSDITRIFD